MIIFLHVTFVLFLGDLPKINEYHKDKMNYRFKEYYPEFYKYLNLIGLRSIVYQHVHYDYKDLVEKQKAMNATTIKLAYYVGSFLISTYCEIFYFEQTKEKEAQEKFEDKDYKKLFEYKI